MSFPKRQLNQTAVYWATPSADGYGGYTWDNPVEISCRWEDTIQVITDSNGEEIVSRAVVYLDQDVDENGVLFLGSLTDLDSTQEADPMTADSAYRIRRFDKVPNIKGTDFLRKAYL
jgi:hypothetical protein